MEYWDRTNYKLTTDHLTTPSDSDCQFAVTKNKNDPANFIFAAAYHIMLEGVWVFISRIGANP